MAHILVVEDDLAIALLLQEVLTEAGHDVRLATDGRQAATMLRKEERIDLLFTDLHLPYIKGTQLIEKVRRSPSMRVLPIIVATGAQPEEWPPHESYQALLEKPYGIDDVLAAVNALLGCVTQGHRTKEADSDGVPR